MTFTDVRKLTLSDIVNELRNFLAYVHFDHDEHDKENRVYELIEEIDRRGCLETKIIDSALGAL